MSFPPPLPSATTEPAVPFEETQWSPVWVFILLIPAALLAVMLAVMGFVRPDGSPLMLLPLAALLLTGNLLCVKTQVDDRFLVVTFGAVFPLYRRRVCVSDIVSVLTVTYDPVGEYGGWGIRGVKGNQCLTARGNAGVRLLFAGGDKLLIGSGRAEALAWAVRPAV